MSWRLTATDRSGMVTHSYVLNRWRAFRTTSSCTCFLVRLSQVRSEKMGVAMASPPYLALGTPRTHVLSPGYTQRVAKQRSSHSSNFKARRKDILTLPTGEPRTARDLARQRHRPWSA